MEVRALALNQPVSPQKVRLVLDVIKGRKVDEGLTLLEFMPQSSARVVGEGVKSAEATYGGEGMWPRQCDASIDARYWSLKLRGSGSLENRVARRVRPRLISLLKYRKNRCWKTLAASEML